MKPIRAPVGLSALLATAIATAACNGARPFSDAQVTTDVVDAFDAPHDAIDAHTTLVDSGYRDASGPPMSHVLPSGVVIAPDTPDDAGSRFGGAPDPTRVPRILYPGDGAILPPNLRDLTLLIDRPLGDDLFELTFRGATESVIVYRACIHVGNPCPLVFDPVLYPLVVHASAPDGEVHVTVRGTSTDGMSPVGTSVPITLGFTQQPLSGAVYYFNTTGGRIARYDFDNPDSPPEGYLGPATCHGCHSLSRDGTRISALAQLSPGYAIRTYQVSTRTPRSYSIPSNLNALSPDGSRLIGSSGTTADNVGLALYDSDSGTLLDHFEGFATVDTAAWSPDGAVVVFAGTLPSDGGLAPSALYRVAVSGDRFGAVARLPIDATDDVLRPAFSWDGQWIAFNRGVSASVPFAVAGLWMVAPTGGAAVHLAHADVDGVGDSRWPRFAPFAVTYQGEPLVWLSFSSPRPLYEGESMPVPQLWMTAIRPTRAARGEDPSATAFWLPFQVRGQGNHDAQWAERVAPSQPCTSDSDCPSGLHCVQLATAGNGRCLGTD